MPMSHSSHAEMLWKNGDLEGARITVSRYGRVEWDHREESDNSRVTKYTMPDGSIWEFRVKDGEVVEVARF